MQSAYLMPVKETELKKLIQTVPFPPTPIIDYAINNRLTPFISMQNHYNLIYREEEREMMPTIKVGKNFSLTTWCTTPPPGSLSQTILPLFPPALWRWLHPVVSTRTWRPNTPLRRALRPC
jgi:hypothetical protein